MFAASLIVKSPSTTRLMTLNFAFSATLRKISPLFKGKVSKSAYRVTISQPDNTKSTKVDTQRVKRDSNAGFPALSNRK